MFWLATAYVVASFLLFSVVTNLLTEASDVANLVGVVLAACWGFLTLCLVRPVSDLTKAVFTKIVPIALVSIVSLTSGACTRIEPGNVGIKVNLTGDDKGVSSTSLVSGRVFYNPWTTDVLEYPTFVQTAQWTKDATENNSGGNEEITFNSKEGQAVSADISLSYSVLRNKVPEFYTKYRSDDLKSFTHGIMRNLARDSFNEIAGHMPVEDIIGPKKEELLEAVKARVNAKMAIVGVVIDQFGFLGALRPPAPVIAAINAKIAATQAAQKAENELRTAEAEARKVVAKAEGDAKAQIARAEGAAKAKVASAEGEAKANALLQQSITPTLLEWRRLSIQEQAVNRWNGQRPQVEGSGSGLLLQVNADK